MPRRFGKSTNLDMLKRFLNKPIDSYGNLSERKRSENYKLFFYPQTDDSFLKINYTKLNSVILEKNILTNIDPKKVQGKFPVIYLDFKDITGENYEAFLLLIQNMLIDLYLRYRYLKKTNDEEDLYSENLENLRKGKIVSLKFSVLNLCKFLYEYHKEKVWILIDEYDAPNNSAFLKFADKEFHDNSFDKNGNFYKITNFLKDFLSVSLKSNKKIYKTVMTGILNAGKHSMTSALNMISNYNLTRNEFSIYYGFHEVEVKEILRKYNENFNEEIDRELKIEEIKKCCNGYTFGNVQGIYNPWSVSNFINSYQSIQGKSLNTIIDPWIETGSLDLLELSRKKSITEILFYLEIFNKKYPEIFLDCNSSSIQYEDILRGENETFLKVLLFTGYLTPIYGKENCVKIPNKKIKSVLIHILQKLSSNQRITCVLVDYLRNEQIDDFFTVFKQQLAKQSEFINFPKKNLKNKSEEENNSTNSYERIYQALLIGVFLDKDDNKFSRTEQSAGKDVLDIVVCFKNEKLGYIIELKASNKEENLEKNVDEAINQIKNKNYLDYFKTTYQNLEKHYIIGLAFYGKEFRYKSIKIE